MITGKPDIERLAAAAHDIQWGSPGIYFWNDLPRVLIAEENVFTTLAYVTDNIPVVLVAQAIFRILERLVPMNHEKPAKLEPAPKRFEALVAAIAARDRDQTRALIDELCRLREQTYIELLPLISEPAKSQP
ncbi:MAG: FCD domain-containing protein [Myxococcaceae bacterium]|nr:FCD domain-containing protein [Myxococcaceae bacterium]